MSVDRTPGNGLDGLLLQLEVQRFYHEEARLLDEQRFADWLELFTDDLRYWAPIRTNRLRRQQSLAVGGPDEVAFFDETRESLRWRIRRLDSGLAWAEEPPSRTRHLVTNVLVRPAVADDLAAGAGDDPVPDAYAASSAFLVYRNRLEHEVNLYSGGRTDLLRRAGDGRLLIARRTILLDQTVLLAKNISTFF